MHPKHPDRLAPRMTQGYLAISRRWNAALEAFVLVVILAVLGLSGGDAVLFAGAWCLVHGLAGHIGVRIDRWWYSR